MEGDDELAYNLILKMNVDISKENNDGKTPLALALANESTKDKMVKLKGKIDLLELEIGSFKRKLEKITKQIVGRMQRYNNETTEELAAKMKSMAHQFVTTEPELASARSKYEEYERESQKDDQEGRSDGGWDHPGLGQLVTSGLEMNAANRHFKITSFFRVNYLSALKNGPFAVCDSMEMELPPWYRDRRVRVRNLKTEFAHYNNQEGTTRELIEFVRPRRWIVCLDHPVNGKRILSVNEDKLEFLKDDKTPHGYAVDY